MRSCTGSIAVRNNRETLIMCLAVRVPKIRMCENKGKPRNRIIARCRGAESYVHPGMLETENAVSKNVCGVGIIAKKTSKSRKVHFCA